MSRGSTGTAVSLIPDSLPAPTVSAVTQDATDLSLDLNSMHK